MDVFWLLLSRLSSFAHGKEEEEEEEEGTCCFENEVSPVGGGPMTSKNREERRVLEWEEGGHVLRGSG